MAVEGAGRRELAEFVTDHVLGHQHRDEFVAVVDAEGQPDELREDGRAARPGLDDLVAARRRATSPPSSVDSRRRTDLSRLSVPRLALRYFCGDDARYSGRSPCSCASWCPWCPCPRGSRDGDRPRCGLRRRHGDDRSGSSPRRARRGPLAEPAVAPGLADAEFCLSGFDTAPIVAMHSARTMRTSPEESRSSA